MKRRELSRKGTKFIAQFEGFIGHAYKPVPTEQFWTIGYGHYGPDVKPGATITKRAARKLLRKDARAFAKSVRRLVARPLKQTQFDALVSFVYNVGEGAFANSTLRQLVIHGDDKAVPAELMKWVHGGGQVLPGLVTRRKAEGRLYAHGRY